jgi:hypothetical protein
MNISVNTLTSIQFVTNMAIVGNPLRVAYFRTLKLLVVIHLKNAHKFCFGNIFDRM